MYPRTTDQLLDDLLFAYDMIRDSGTQEQAKRWDTQFKSIRDEIIRRAGELSERPA